jgi:small-conductance mechanosensitive channel
MRRPRLPFARGAKRAAEGSPPSSAKAEQPGAQKPSATSPAPATPQAPADPQERIDGLRAWVAQIDRRLGIRTYLGAAIAVLALAAAAVGLVLTLSLKQDAATDDDVQSLRDQIATVEQSASQAALQDVQSLRDQLTELEAELNKVSSGQTTTKRELKVVQDDIKELRSEVSSISSSSSDSSSSDAGSQGSGGSQGSSP